MRTVVNSSALYSPSLPPTDPAQLQRYLIEEFNKIAAAIVLLANGHLDVTTAAPAKARDGDWRYADGVGWNPGGGKGIYFFTTAWTLIKALP